MLSPYGKMIGGRIELNAMNRFFQLKSFNYFVIPLVNNVKSSLFPARNNIIAFTTYSIDIRFMNIPYFMTKTTDSQIPDSDLLVLTTCYAKLIVLECYIFNFIMALQHCHRFYYIC